MTSLGGSETIIKSAIYYAKHFGLYVLPVVGKRPCTPHGYLDATSNLEEISAWAQTYRNITGVAAATGKRSGILAVDIDLDPTDPSSCTEITEYELARAFGELPLTWRAVSGSGGVHVFLDCRALPPIQSRTRFFPMTDVKAEGGYIVLPPSRHSSGREYAWDLRPGDVALAPVPAALATALVSSTARPGGADGCKWMDLFANEIGPGARHNSLVRLAGGLVVPKPSFALRRLLFQNFAATRLKPRLSDEEALRVYDGLLEKEERRILNGGRA